MASAMRIHLMVLSDDPSVADLANRVVTKYSDIVLAESVGNWAELESNSELPGSIILLDVDLVGEDSSTELIRQARRLGSRVVTVSGGGAPAFVMRAMAAGADAALRKSDSSRRVSEQLRLAAHRARLIHERSTQH